LTDKIKTVKEKKEGLIDLKYLQKHWSDACFGAEEMN
jgi:hypothetical protein